MCEEEVNAVLVRPCIENVAKMCNCHFNPFWKDWHLLGTLLSINRLPSNKLLIKMEIK